MMHRSVFVLLVVGTLAIHGFKLSPNHVLPRNVETALNSGYTSDSGYSRTVETKSNLWRRIFGRSPAPGRVHLQEADRMMGQRSHRRRKKAGSLILVRNGESEGNTIFAGWSDPDLSDKGKCEVQHAARLLRESGYDPDVIFTSRLRRAIHSVWFMLREMDQAYLPCFKSWRLNARHYGKSQATEGARSSRRIYFEQILMLHHAA